MEKELLEIISIDESGITSKTGHSVYAFLFVYLKDYIPISQSIIEIEKTLKLQHIHRSKLSWNIRLRIAKKLIPIDFKIEFVVYKNPIVQNTTLETSLIQVFNKPVNVQKIIIDGKKNKLYRNKIKKILKNNNFKIYNIKMVNDKSEPILRLSDFVAGSVRCFLDDSENIYAKYIYKTFEHKIINKYNIKSPT